jgi:hypothetical protein
MFLAGFAALVVAQAGGSAGAIRTPVAFNCIAVPVLMSAQVETEARRAARVRDDRRQPRPMPRCLRLSAR